MQNDGWRVISSRARHDEPVKPAQVLWRETQVYQSYVRFSAVFSAGPDAAARSEGAGILGMAYKRRRDGDRLRVTVNFTAYSPHANEIVAALFIGSGPKSVSLSSQPVTRGNSASATLTYIVDNLTDAPMALEVRVGARRPGGLYINGDHTGPGVPGLTSLTIEELGSLPGEELLQRRDLTLEQMRQHGDLLVYIGAPLSESERVKTDQPLAEQVRESWAGAFARTFADVEQWIIGKVRHNATGP